MKELADSLLKENKWAESQIVVALQILLIATNDSLNRIRDFISQDKFSDTVLVGEDEICKVLSFVRGAIDTLSPTLFQVANVHTGEIKFVHGEEVREIVATYEQEVCKDWKPYLNRTSVLKNLPLSFY